MQKSNANFENCFTNLDSRNTTKQLVYFKHNVIQKLFMTNVFSKLEKKPIQYVYRGTCMQKKNVAFKKINRKVYIYDTVI